LKPTDALVLSPAKTGSGFMGDVIPGYARPDISGLAHPGLNSIAAPRLVAPDIHGESSQRDFAYTLGRATQQIVGRAWTAAFSTVTRSHPPHAGCPRGDPGSLSVL